MDIVRTIKTQIQMVKNLSNPLIYTKDVMGFLKDLSEIKMKDGTVLFFRPKTGDSKVFREIFIEKQYTSLDGRKDSIIVDIGAHIGLFSIYAATRKGNTIEKIYAFEPLKENFEVLKKNIHRNKFDGRIIPVNKAIYKVDGKISLFSEPAKQDLKYHKTSVYSDRNKEQQKVADVDCITLKTMFDEYDIERCDLLKIDCEGSEYDILLTADISTMSKIQEIVLEYHSFTTHSVSDLQDFLVKSGFHVDVYPDTSKLYARRVLPSARDIPADDNART